MMMFILAEETKKIAYFLGEKLWTKVARKFDLLVGNRNKTNDCKLKSHVTQNTFESSEFIKKVSEFF